MPIMWKIALWTTLAYCIIWLITKIFDKRKVRKYGKNITIGRADNRNDTGNDTANNDGNTNVGTDKQ